jgi:CRP-like cAMP-binding protein
MSARYVELLKSTTFFGGFSQRSLETIAALAREVGHDAGDVVVEEGSTAYGIHLIVDGTAEVLVGGSPVAELGAGDTFGEVALLDEGPRTATVAAKTDLTVLAIHGTAFRNALEKEPAMAWVIVKHLAGLLREIDAQIADVRADASFR